MVFKNNAPFINCSSKINCAKIEKAENLDVVMSMYNLLEYGKNYKKTTGSLWNYYRDEPSNPLSSNSESFKCKTSIIEKTPDNNDTLENVRFAAPLKHLSNFWRRLDMPLINCEIELTLIWSENCILTDMTVRNANPQANPSVTETFGPTGATFKITETKLFVAVVILSTENEKKLLEELKSGFKRTVKWNKHGL